MQLHSHAASPWGNRHSSPRFCCILPALYGNWRSPMESHSALGACDPSPRFLCFWRRWLHYTNQEHCQSPGSEHSATWMKIPLGCEPEHGFLITPSPEGQMLNARPFLSMQKLNHSFPVTQPHTNQTTATGLLLFNTCLSKYIWGLLLSDSSIWTLGIFFYIYLLGR